MKSSCGTIAWTDRARGLTVSIGGLVQGAGEKKSLTGRTAVRDFRWRFQDLKSLGFWGSSWGSRHVSLLFGGWCCGGSGFSSWSSSVAAWLCSGLAAGANDQATAWLRLSGLAAWLGFAGWCWCGSWSSFAGWCWCSSAAAFLCGTAATGFSRAGEHKCCQQSQQCHVTHCEILF